MEAFRIYLSAIPRLTDRIIERLAETLEEGLVDPNQPDALQQAHEGAREAALQRLRQTRTAYHHVWHPRVQEPCPTCQQLLTGAYWELCNPQSGARALVPTRLVHELVAHRRTAFEQQVLSLTGTTSAASVAEWPVEAVLRVLEGLSVPPAALTELRAHGSKLAAARTGGA
ncbi:MAG: hypothetical protein VKQ33_11900 [Candidatus Sericytochromatia bacterium]|nr:hypothetical protein [Candidatus Sericytochromatia bacterium]